MRFGWQTGRVCLSPASMSEGQSSWEWIYEVTLTSYGSTRAAAPTACPPHTATTFPCWIRPRIPTSGCWRTSEFMRGHLAVMIVSHFSGLSRNLFLRRCNLMPTLGQSVASDEIDLPARLHSQPDP